MGFAAIFPNRAFIEVLLFFLLHPDEETYLARIVRATGNALIQVQRGLKRLEEAGLITRILRGHKAYFRANMKHAAFKDLKRVVLKTIIFSDPIDQELSSIQSKVKYGFIFGSTAIDTDSSDSDIDLFLIGDLSYQEAGRFSFPLSMKLGREVNTAIYSLKDFKKKIKEKSPFILEVIQGAKIWLLGDEDEFKKIFG